MSQSHHECASWTKEIISGVLVSEPISLSVSVMAYSSFASCSVTRRWCGEDMWLTWASLRGRSSAACYHGWPSWCRRPGSRRSRPPLCSAAPGPDDRRRHFIFRTKYKTTSRRFRFYCSNWTNNTVITYSCMFTRLLNELSRGDPFSLLSSDRIKYCANCSKEIMGHLSKTLLPRPDIVHSEKILKSTTMCQRTR